MKKKLSLFLLCEIVLLIACGCGNNKITNEVNKNTDVKEDIDIKKMKLIQKITILMKMLI